MTAKKYLQIVLLILAIVPGGCKKYLDEKPYQNLAIPSTLGDLQALLDDFNLEGFSPSAELLTDDYYVTTADWQTHLSSVNIYPPCKG